MKSRPDRATRTESVREKQENTMSFDIMYADQGLVQQDRQPMGDANQNVIGNLTEYERKFMHFLQESQERNTFIYR